VIPSLPTQNVSTLLTMGTTAMFSMDGNADDRICRSTSSPIWVLVIVGKADRNLDDFVSAIFFSLALALVLMSILSPPSVTSMLAADRHIESLDFTGVDSCMCTCACSGRTETELLTENEDTAT